MTNQRGVGRFNLLGGVAWSCLAVMASAPAWAQADTDIIVTAQKKEERIIDVPIAMTALSGDALDAYKIEGGSELLRAIPNVNFSKSNFSMYNFAIRGIGTKAISASSDPAVAVSFNSTPLVRNRLFESEFFDMQRIEVLRGPQGTLYGRNATAGVVNLIPVMPQSEFEGMVKAEVGNYDSRRLNAMLNLPLGPNLAVRVSGAMTKRDGFDYNSFNKTHVNDRDLWSTRAVVEWKPSDRFRANLIWQHFEEDDNRSRTGKQLCTRDPGVSALSDGVTLDPLNSGRLSQGCLPSSLYSDAAYGVPNGNSLAFTPLANTIFLGYQPGPNPLPSRVVGEPVYATKSTDPYDGVVQSRNLREIATSYDPVFRAKNDLLQLNFEINPSETVKIFAQTAYSKDRYYSSQDYNRFPSNPMFNDSSQPLVDGRNRPLDTVANPGPTPNGIFCDFQLGCSDRMLSVDISQSRSRQWSQELRLQTDSDGPLNFNIGANYMDFKSQDDYYVFNNLFTLLADWFYSKDFVGNFLEVCEKGVGVRECPFVERSPLDALENEGHNYFLSQNGIRIKSLGLFGEVYWDLGSDLKLTLGGRYTEDKKRSDQIPSQLLLGGGSPFAGVITGGRVNSGYPALPDIHQKWGEFTGRAVLDWKPTLSFTDETMMFVSAARGYKGGGTNPPRVDFNPAVVQYQPLAETFRPEFVTALEVGMKNNFDGGRFTLNAGAFFYDYTDYQVSQIVDRIAYNENFDATSFGLEFEGAWKPSRAFRVDGNLGFLKTRLKKGSRSIDVMNRTQGDPNLMLVRPWLQVPSNCVAPKAFVEKVAAINLYDLSLLCPGATQRGTFNPALVSDIVLYKDYGFTYDPFLPYNPATVGLDIADGGSGAPNGGRGHFANLDGNELPNSPRFTANIGAQYTLFFDSDNWNMTLRGDYYRQSKSFARIYNTEFDRLRSWGNINLALSLSRPESGLSMQIYVKNLANKSPITDFFVNSDDTGLTANVFTVDPRIVGFSASKTF